MTRVLRALLFVAAGVCAVTACSWKKDEIVRGSAVDHGRALFDDPRASPSPSNAFACATCHPSEKTEDRIFSGASLEGATTRKSFWGGRRLDLLEALNDCRLLFMDAPAPWKVGDENARAMYAYLAQLPAKTPGAAPLGAPARSAGATAQTRPAPFTLRRTVEDLSRGSRDAGEKAFTRACAVCHGTAHEGVGRLVTFAPILPDAIDRSHASLTKSGRRAVYVKKIRSGAFVASNGSMPPFSEEALSDDDVRSILAYLDQY